MKRPDNRQRILDTALQLYAQNGYSNTSMRHLAKGVGIRESSLYNHFIGKEAILHALVGQYDKKMSVFAPLPDDLLKEIQGKDAGTILKMGLVVFDTFFTAPEVVQLLRILSMEKYTNPLCQALYIKLLFHEPIQYQTMFFQHMMDTGIIGISDPKQLAIMVFSPILYVWEQHDTMPIKEARHIIDCHITLFGKMLDSLRVKSLS